MNRYNGLLDPIEKKYEGQIVEILNNARIRMSECDDMYSKNVNKYKYAVIDEAMNDIGEIQTDYVNNCKNVLETERKKLNASTPVTRSNTEKLLDAINLQNRLKINDIKYGNMNIDELLDIGAETESELDLQQIKYIALGKLNNSEVSGEEKQALLASIRAMKGNTLEMQFKAFEGEIRALEANKS